jgi:hypothetical protein
VVSQHSYEEENLSHSVHECITSLSIIIIAVSDFSGISTFLWGRTFETLCIWMHSSLAVILVAILDMNGFSTTLLGKTFETLCMNALRCQLSLWLQYLATHACFTSWPTSYPLLCCSLIFSVALVTISHSVTTLIPISSKSEEESVKNVMSSCVDFKWYW